MLSESIKNFKNKWIWKDYKPRSYSSVDEMLEAIKEDAFLEGIYKSIYYPLLRMWEAPGDYARSIKWGLQRAQRGWSDRDAWGAYYYLTRVIIETCEYIREYKHGVPMQCFKKNDPVDDTGNHTDEAMELAMKRWDLVLSRIILTFKIAQCISEDHWHYQNSKNYDKKEAEKYRKFQKELREKHPDSYDEYFGYVMSKEECEVYERGWRLFRKFFFNLWD